MPGPIYNWLCVAHSIVDVLSNAAVIRASQVYPRTVSAAVPRNLKRRTAQPMNLDGAGEAQLDPFVGVDSGVKTPSNALDGAGDACAGAYMRWVHHLVGLIKFRRYSSDARAHRPGIVRTSTRVHTDSSVSQKLSNVSHRPTYRRTRTPSPARSYGGNFARRSFGNRFCCQCLFKLPA